MEKRARRRFSAEFKTKVVLEALKERHTIEQIAKKYEIHPNQISTWKKEFLENASAAFGTAKEVVSEKDTEARAEKLHAKIGELQMEVDWLKKKLK